MQKIKMFSLLLSFIMLTSTLVSCKGEEKQTTDVTGTAYTQDMPPPDGDTETSISEDEYINVRFSVPAGFYAEEKTLALMLPENAPSGAYITYTTDGNEPSSRGKKYTDEITVCAADGASCVRAACYSRRGELLGRIMTNTYIRCDQDRFSTMVVSITADTDDLYGNSGIISNPTQSGKAWERPCHVEMFTQAGDAVVSQDAGLRLFGGSSRTLQQKSFRLVARKSGYYDAVKYSGAGSFKYPFFEGRKVLGGPDSGKELDTYDRLILRNGGNDSLLHTAQNPNDPNLLRDSVVNRFAAQYAPEISTQASRFVTVYLNGEYYGILDMKEDINDDYFKNLYGIENKDAITVVKSELDTTRKCELHMSNEECRFCGVWFYYEVDNGDPNALGELEAIYNMVTQAADENRAGVYAQLAEKIDLESFIQYMALNMFVCNNDWPHNNVRLWRYSGTSIDGQPYTDGKWRFTMRDADFAFGRYSSGDPSELYTKADSDSLNFSLGTFYENYKYSDDYGDPLYLKSILNFCLKNEQFKKDFEAYCLTLASKDATRCLYDLMKQGEAEISREMPYYLERWQYAISPDMTYDGWMKSVTLMRRWTDSRGKFFSQYLSECLSNY